MDLGSRLDEDHRAVYRAMPERLMELTDIPATRVQVSELRAKMYRSPLPEGLRVDDRAASGSSGQPDVMVRLYVPAQLATPAPALLWIHGGGMVLGDVDMDDEWCAATAAQLGIVVASADYRLAPEAPFPSPLEDCYTALRWLAEQADALGVDRSRIAIGGASAGGGLAAGLGLLARDRGELRVAFQLLVYPMLDDRNTALHSPSSTDPKVWNRRANEIGWNAYLSGRAGTDDVSPYAAPARATDVSGLPPTYINVGDLDLFLDEDIAYAQGLMRAGVPVELHVYPGAFHGSNTFVSRSQLSQRWSHDERAALARALQVEG